MGKRRTKVHIITMGCAKNAVDSEKLMAQLALNGIELTPRAEDAEIAVVNTCGFIDAAKRESIDAIIGQVKRKNRGSLRKVIAIGCLTERYGAELRKEIPEVDRFFGSDSMEEVIRELGGRLRTELLGERVLTNPSHYAFLKISEGCDNPCSFCAIPLMRGRYTGRREEEIIAEAERLAAKGVRELILIGQDTTYFGAEAGGERRLAGLVERLAGLQGIAWVRLMYAYPAKFPLDVLEVMAGHPHVCKYLDLPIQHVSDAVLRSMRRGISGKSLRALIDTIRDRVPGIALRTTVIAGYPAEGEKEFEELLEFVRSVRFDRLGVFAYSPEEGTAAYALGDPVSSEEKERRRSLIMEAQQEISASRNQALIGTRRTVLIDEVEGQHAVGRTESDAPEIDNEVHVTSPDPLSPGEFVAVDIVGASEYDVYGSAGARVPEPVTGR